jgi:hypothetical protein
MSKADETRVPPIREVIPPMGDDAILGPGQSMFIVVFDDDVGFNVIVPSEEGRKAGFRKGIPTVEWFRERLVRYVSDRATDGRPALEQMAERRSPIVLTAD